MSPREIDVLFEDPPISGQTFALVSIVGPNLSQKCNVYGLKVRGVAESMEKAKAMTQRLMKIDNNYDIYTVEVGKFFPLDVDPHNVGEVEYENEQLNTLIKSYLENKELANDQWHARKNEMIKEAIKEGQSKDKTPEHPVSIVQRIRNFEQSITEYKNNIDIMQQDMILAREALSKYSDEDVTNAFNILNNNGVQSTLEEIKACEEELVELNKVGSSTTTIDALQEKIANLKLKLADSDTNDVNKFINNNFQDSPYNSLDN